MRKKRVWRFYCEHCKKAGCSGGHMAKHEAHCCGNPDRVCRMCRVNKSEPNAQKPMAELLAAYENGGSGGVREAAGGCPACMLAAMIIWRKQNEDASDEERWCSDFDFKAESQRWLNENRSEYDVF